MDDFYQLLDVPPDADDRALRVAYLRRAEQLHPDRGDGSNHNGDAFKQLQWAYEVLSHPASRRQYDRSPDQFQHFGARPAGRSPTPEPPAPRTPPIHPVVLARRVRQRNSAGVASHPSATRRRLRDLLIRMTFGAMVTMTFGLLFMVALGVILTFVFLSIEATGSHSIITQAPTSSTPPDNRLVTARPDTIPSAIASAPTPPPEFPPSVHDPPRQRSDLMPRESEQIEADDTARFRSWSEVQTALAWTQHNPSYPTATLPRAPTIDLMTRATPLLHAPVVDPPSLELSASNGPEWNRPEWNRPEWNRPEWNRPEWNRPEWNRPELERSAWELPDFTVDVGAAIVPLPHPEHFDREFHSEYHPPIPHRETDLERLPNRFLVPIE